MRTAALREALVRRVEGLTPRKARSQANKLAHFELRSRGRVPSEPRFQVTCRYTAAELDDLDRARGNLSRQDFLRSLFLERMGR